MDWTHLLTGLLCIAGPWVWLRVVDNTAVYNTFKRFGKASSFFMKGKLSGWNKIENSLQTTLEAMYTGFVAGLDEDDD